MGQSHAHTDMYTYTHTGQSHTCTKKCISLYKTSHIQQKLMHVYTRRIHMHAHIHTTKCMSVQDEVTHTAKCVYSGANHT